VKLPFWQGMAEIVTTCVLPGDNVPLAGVKVTPLRLLPVVHFAMPTELADSASATLQWYVKAGGPSAVQFVLF